MPRAWLCNCGGCCSTSRRQFVSRVFGRSLESCFFPGQLASFWTGHSARHVLTSIAAALGVGKDRRDYLGRWAYAQHGSQDYVLTSRQVVQGVQNFVCRSLILGHESGGYSEEELFWAVKAHADSLLLEGAEIVKANDLLQWDDVQRTWKLDAQLPGPYEPFEGKEDGDEAPYFRGGVHLDMVRMLHVAHAMSPVAAVTVRTVLSIALLLLDGVSEADALDHLDKKVSSDLVHIFQECGVPLGLQYKLTQHFQNVKRFSTYADSRAEVRNSLIKNQSFGPKHGCLGCIGR
ncbi:unnamed protein product [Symbiodinium necroappetens]|uniref:Uncharacterized protein n=1 Tax=Symbiodinium necroappetens TaxID=1628268 RepID=A0A813ACB0_9DINO|nr:unnamed protein product [Symbiodinium necroappetens]